MLLQPDAAVSVGSFCTIAVTQISDTRQSCLLLLGPSITPPHFVPQHDGDNTGLLWFLPATAVRRRGTCRTSFEEAEGEGAHLHTTLLFAGSEVTDADSVVAMCGTLSFIVGCPVWTRVQEYRAGVNLQRRQTQCSEFSLKNELFFSDFTSYLQSPQTACTTAVHKVNCLNYF